MTARIVTAAGFYDGKFLKPGSRSNGVEQGLPALAAMTKDELLALAETRGLQVRSSDTKAEIIEALEGAA